MIPAEFGSIENITDYLEDFDHIRLSNDERESLNQALFPNAVCQLLRKIKGDKDVAEKHIENIEHIYAVKVETSDGQTYFALKINNDLSVRCDEKLFNKSPIQKEIRYNDPLSRLIAPPAAQQLIMFE